MGHGKVVNGPALHARIGDAASPRRTHSRFLTLPKEDWFTMCHLALMNTGALQVLGQPGLVDLLTALERGQKGHGTGVAALWQETARVTLRKGMALTTVQAARHLVTFGQAEADWLLYHTRRTNCGRTGAPHCQPFQAGKLTLAHHGQDGTWAPLASHLGLTASEFITQMWGRVPLPLEALMEVHGVFLGFRGAFPFVVKTSPLLDLVLAVNREAHALLFVSHLPQDCRERFDEIIDLGRFLWLGVAPLDLNLLPRREPSSSSNRQVASPRQTPPPAFSAQDGPAAGERTGAERARITPADLRAFLANVKARKEDPIPASSARSTCPPSADPTV